MPQFSLEPLRVLRRQTTSRVITIIKGGIGGAAYCPGERGQAANEVCVCPRCMRRLRWAGLRPSDHFSRQRQSGKQYTEEANDLLRGGEEGRGEREAKWEIKCTLVRPRRPRRRRRPQKRAQEILPRWSIQRRKGRGGEAREERRKGRVLAASKCGGRGGGGECC